MSICISVRSIYAVIRGLSFFNSLSFSNSSFPKGKKKGCWFVLDLRVPASFRVMGGKVLGRSLYFINSFTRIILSL